MKPACLLPAACLLAVLAGPAHATLVNCTVSSPATSVAYVDTAATATQTPVTFTLNCTRSGNPKNNTVRISLSQAASETMPNTTSVYADTLRYNYYTDTGYSRLWSTGAASTTGPGSIEVPVNFTANNTSASTTFTAYMSIPALQTGKAAGTYTGSLGTTLYDITLLPLGTQLSTGSVNASATIAKSCNFSSTLPAWSLSYTAFRPAAITDSSQSVGLICTRGTSYTLQLDQTSDVVPAVELQYSLVFTATSNGTVANTPTTSGATNTHGLTLTVPAGQPGACSAAPCSGTSVRTLTVTY